MIREKSTLWGKEDLGLSVAKISPNRKCLSYFHLQNSLHVFFLCSPTLNQGQHVTELSRT